MRHLYFLLIAFIVFSAPLCGKDLRVRVLEKYSPRSITVSFNGEKTGFSENGLTGEPRPVFGGRYGIYEVTAGNITRKYPGVLYLCRAPEGTGIKIIFSVREEDYIPCVLASESSAEVYTPESMKALAVAVRSYLRANTGRHPDYDLCDLTHCELYKGIPDDFSLWQGLAASTGTMTIEGKNRERVAYFSTCCGGVTEEPSMAWDCRGIAAGYSRQDALQGEPLCSESPFYRWQRAIKPGELRRVLKKMGASDPGRIFGFSISSKSGSGRACDFSFTTADEGIITVNSSDFISAFGREYGWNRFPSKLFEITEKNGGWLLNGRGLGHGAGICLFGAAKLAKMGWDYRRILEFYYPGAVYADGG
ncbi:MAG: SpoIID/LytB domain-containing protein [Spirochaetia bacterium]|nr:SpoIID/LytB domain-containing protein [Spirochaetia bacterium]